MYKGMYIYIHIYVYFIVGYSAIFTYSSHFKEGNWDTGWLSYIAFCQNLNIHSTKYLCPKRMVQKHVRCVCACVCVRERARKCAWAERAHSCMCKEEYSLGKWFICLNLIRVAYGIMSPLLSLQMIIHDCHFL